MRGIVFTGLWAAASFLVACSDATGPQNPDLAGEVGVSGGTVKAAGGKVELEFPAGAVSSDVEITVKAAEASTVMGTVPGTAYDFGPDGTVFSAPVQLTLSYDPTALPEGTTEASLGIYKQTTSGWERIDGATVDPSLDRVKAPILSFSVYAVMSDPCRNARTISLGSSVSGTLSEDDCQPAGEKLQDQYSLTLGATSAFRTTLATQGFSPFIGAYVQGGRRLSGLVRSGGTEVSGIHVYPAGTYDLFVSSVESRASEQDPWPVGAYTLEVTGASMDPDGCVPFIFVASGVSVAGRIAADDCEDTVDPRPGTRWFDGYAILARAGETLTATVTADFPFGASIWNGSNGEILETRWDQQAGTTVTFQQEAAADGYFMVYAISGGSMGTGNYTVTVALSGGS